jgi:hypothetical protein
MIPDAVQQGDGAFSSCGLPPATGSAILAQAGFFAFAA